MSLSMQTVQKSPQEPHEPVAVACTFHPNCSPDASDMDRDLRTGMKIWCAVRRCDTRPLPRDPDNVLKKNNIAALNSEPALLSQLVTKIQEFDPDVIAAHNAYGFDLDVLSVRMQALRLNNWQ